MKKLTPKPLTEEEIKELAKYVRKQRKLHPEFKPEIYKFKIEILKHIKWQ